MRGRLTRIPYIFFYVRLSRINACKEIGVTIRGGLGIVTDKTKKTVNRRQSLRLRGLIIDISEGFIDKLTENVLFWYKICMTSIVALSCELKSFFQRLHARKLNNFAIEAWFKRRILDAPNQILILVDSNEHLRLI